MTEPARPAAVAVSLPRVLMFIACLLFALAALAAGNIVTSIAPWAFGFGGFAAVALAQSVP
jgi:hypothetical protein